MAELTRAEMVEASRQFDKPMVEEWPNGGGRYEGRPHRARLGSAPTGF
jgi:hypothetical protein